MSWQTFLDKVNGKIVEEFGEIYDKIVANFDYLKDAVEEGVDPYEFDDHSARHEKDGDDEIDVTGLSGELADEQKPKAHAGNHVDSTDDIQDATALQKGLMTAAYAEKLDGVANEANKYELEQHAIAGNDHSASTLADLNGKISDYTFRDWLSEDVVADAGSAHEVDWAKKNHYITLTENCAITFKDPIKNAKLTIVFYGEFDITLPAGTKRIVGTSLEMSGETMLVVTYDGTDHIVMSSDIEEIT